MMPSFLESILLDSMLVQSAVRALALALVVGAVLTLLRVRNPHHRLAAWTAVLGGAMAMPMLMSVMIVSIPVVEPRVPAGIVAEPLAAYTSASALPIADGAAASEFQRIDGALATTESFDWPTALFVAYALVAGVLLLRLGVGLYLGVRMRATSEPIRDLWAGRADVRVSRHIRAPVTVGATILLPADYDAWSVEKRHAVLLHESAHVARGDFFVQAFAAAHRAVFWFSPLAWWLHDHLAELAEDARDAEAAAQVETRADYAAVLLDFAQAPAAPRLQFAPLAVAMARPATVRRRIEQVLEKTLPGSVGQGARALTAILVVMTACAAAVSIVRIPAADAAAGIQEVPLPPEAPLPPMAPLPPTDFDARSLELLGRSIDTRVPPVRVDLSRIGAAGGDFDVAAGIGASVLDREMEELHAAVDEAAAARDWVSESVAARIEAAAERAQRKMERAHDEVARRAEQAARLQVAAADSGTVTKETRTVGDFSGVSFGGAGKVFITVGPKASLVLEADSEILSRTRTEVDDDGVLRIRQRGGHDGWGRRGDVTAYITVPALKVARVSGSGLLKVTGLNGGQTELSISGSGNVEADGKLERLDIEISGSGSAKMESLVVGDAEVSISGSGSAIVDVRESLDVRVSGSGSVRYLGQPKDIDTSISGSGSVRRRDAT